MRERTSSYGKVWHALEDDSTESIKLRGFSEIVENTFQLYLLLA